MYNFILQILVFSSLGLVIYLLARAMPRVGDVAEPQRQPNLFDKLMNKMPMEKIDENINFSLAKILRKFRVLVLKVDNFINHRLGKLNKKSGASRPEDEGPKQMM